MTQQPEALRLAESLEADFKSDTFNFDDMIEAAAELRRLYAEVDRLSYRLAYPNNFAREWVGLTEEDKEAIYEEYVSSPQSFMEITEAKLKEKNT